jgi:hypothetical protein
MKVTILKYLNQKGKVVEMRKDNFKGSYMPENIIEEYEVEIKDIGVNETDWLEDLKIKYATGNYILLTPNSIATQKWIKVEDPLWDCENYVLIHNKHKDILEAYLKNPSVEIETEMFALMTGETEPSKWIDLKKDFIEDYNEEFWYRLKVKDLAWYEDENMVGKLLKAENSQTGLNELCILKHKGKDSITAIGLDGKEFIGFFSNFRPATESEVLSLVYKPQQKVSKENTLAESNRLRDLFLDNKAECLVETEQEFRLVYDFLDKNGNKKLGRYLEIDEKFNYNRFYGRFPIVISTLRKWGNVYEWDILEDRVKSKPLIKFNGETFWEVVE